MRRGIFGGLGLVDHRGHRASSLYLSVFIVDQTRAGAGAALRRSGARRQRAARRVDAPSQRRTPGLYYKLPLIDNVVYFEKRILDLDSPPLEIIASDQKRLVVDAFGRYKIIDPLLFFQSVGTVEGADSRLSSFLNSAVRRVLGEASFIQLVRDQRADLMARITEQVDREARGLGIELVDVKIRRADLPAENSQAIYQRMQTERQRQATEIRAQGEQAARRIRAEADRTATVIVAEANGEARAAARRRRGRASTASSPKRTARTRISSPSTGRCWPISRGCKPSDTRLVITPDSEFFRYFNDPTGHRRRQRPAAPTPAPAP